MTDKELAEEYAKNTEPVEFNYYLKKRYSEKQIKEAFLAGLKAGRPKWHKVADGDLPKEQKEYWCKVFYYDSEDTFDAFLWFDVKDKGFKFLEEIENDAESTFNVKAWCEIPKYTEE